MMVTGNSLFIDEDSIPWLGLRLKQCKRHSILVISKSLVFSASSCPVCLAIPAPNLLICFSASFSQPPSVSSNRGSKVRT